jgi:putative salt-induced outer membrane protein YdiY
MLHLTSKPHDTLCYHRNGGQQKIAQGNISLFINDTNNWKLHQAMDIIFVDEVDMMNYGFAIYTDATNQFALSGNYQKLVGVIPQVTTTKPIITIICIDEENYEFIVTIK